MGCARVATPFGGAIVCAPTRRVCDICDRPATGPPMRLRDSGPFDACDDCRVGVEMVRAAVMGPLPADAAVLAWGVLAGNRVREVLAGAR